MSRAFSSDHYKIMTAQKPRGRPRTFDRQQALEAAMQLFWRHGYEGTSLADLTEAMGFTPPTLYAAFGSKEQLYREALEQYAQKGEQTVARMMSEEVSAYAALEQQLRTLATRFTDPARPAGCMLQTASLYCAAENEAVRTAATFLRTNAFQLLIAKLEQAKRKGELAPETDTHALARFYSAIVQGMSVQAIDGASAVELGALVDLALAAWPGTKPD